MVAALTGFVSGFVASIPVGPINITIVNEGAKRGFVWALLIGLGAVLMESIYCGLAFAGFSGLLGGRLAAAFMELASFLLMLYLGVKYLRARDLPATTPSVERMEHRLHPHTAFMTGFVRVLGNPAVLLFWLTLSATFVSHHWIEDTLPSKAACVAGVAVGALAWFTLLAFLVARSHGKFSKTTLLRMSHVSGLLLVLAAAGIGFRLVLRLAKQ